MQDVQPLRLVLAEDRSHHRIDEGLHRAIGHRDEQRTPVEIRKAGGAQCEHQRHHVAACGKQRYRFVADAVNDQAEENDAQRKRPHARPIDGSLLRLGQVEAVLQFPDGGGAYPKHKRSGNEGDEAGPEEFHVGFAGGGLSHGSGWE